MTAIAAVFALSSTASFAQVAENPAPIVETSPAPDPLAPEAGTPTSTPEPVVSETTAAPAPAARRATRASRPAARVTTTQTRSATRARAPAPVPAPAAVEAAPPAASAPVDPLLVPPEMVAPTPVATPAPPIPEPAQTAIDQAAIEEALPYAGAAGLGLLMLAGTGIAMRRRRRRREDAIENAKWQHIVAQPESAFESDPAPAAVIAPAPTFVRTQKPAAAPVATNSGASTLPEGFDTSRFGPNVQAAYAGPSPENPSLSLKRRLTVGHFLDQKAAEAAKAAPAQAAAAPSARTPAAKPAFARADGDFMFRRDYHPPRVKPAFQK